MENNKSTRIAPDICSDSRRSGRCILYVFVFRNNAESGQKDKQDGEIYFFHWPKIDGISQVAIAVNSVEEVAENLWNILGIGP